MRIRTIVLVAAILLVAGLAALNWSEIVRPSPLLLGPVVVEAPLGLILLALLALTLVLFLASTIALRTQSLVDYRAQQKALEAQRLLADQAEASRFATLQAQLEQTQKLLLERLDALERRVEGRLQAGTAGTSLPPPSLDSGASADLGSGTADAAPGQQPVSGWRKWF